MKKIDILINKFIKSSYFKLLIFFFIFVVFADSINNLHDKKANIKLKFDNIILNKANNNKNSDLYWANKVIEGGYILHFRHTQREKWNDATAFDALELQKKLTAEKESFIKATCLTEQGVEEAKLINKFFNILDIKISEVISSPSCRARMTSQIAFGKIDKISNSLLHRTAMTPKQGTIMAKQLKKLVLDLNIEKGKNIILSGHGGTIEDNYDGKKFIDINKYGNLERDEGGFVIIEKVNNKLIAVHKFKRFSNFINQIIEFPVN
jgi:hypothetical protein